LTLEWAVSGERLREGLCMSSPFCGVQTLALVIAQRTVGQFDAMPWAIVSSVMYSLAAAGLLLAARASHSEEGCP
jgi:hypothetical protein